MSAYSSLIKIASQILISCPISRHIDDWNLPKYVSERRRFLMQDELDKLDSWIKDMAVNVRNAARNQEVL